MGCLLFSLELLFDGIVEGWFFLMQLIVPERYFTHTIQFVLRVFIYIFSSLLFITMFLGVFALVSSDSDAHLLGKYMVFIPLVISVIQITLGIIVRVITKKQK